MAWRLGVKIMLRHRVAIACEAGTRGKTSETASQKIFDALPVPCGEGRIKNAERNPAQWEIEMNGG